MKKTFVVVLVSVVLVLLFFALIYYGLRHRRGAPVEYTAPEAVAVEIPFLDEEIDLSRELGQEIWQALPATSVELMYQVTVLPWPQKLVPVVEVRAFHNQKDVYFFLSWADETEDRTHGIGRFPDACAVMFALEEVKPTTIMMGFLSKTSIWHWKASQDQEFWSGEREALQAYTDFTYPFEEEELFPVSKDSPEAAIHDLSAIRVGTVTPKETQAVQGRGFWEEGSWQVVFKRPLQEIDPEIDAVFRPGEKMSCALGVWSGQDGDRGGRKSISDWVELRIQ